MAQGLEDEMKRDAPELAEMRADLHGLVHFACDTSTACDVVTAIDALLAAARAEALEEAAQPMEDDGMARHEDDEVRRVLAHHVRRIRALVKP